MNYFFLEPEVAGGLGEHTEMDRSVHPPKVTKLHYRFDGWLGDSILETFPSFIVTEDAKRELQSNAITGVHFDEVEVSLSDEFRDLHPTMRLPKFCWLKIDGRAGEADFGLARDNRLVVSGLALELLRRLGIANAVTETYQG